MRSMSLSNHHRRESVSSLERKQLNKTKRVYSLGKSPQLIRLTAIEQAKTTRVLGCNSHESFSPKPNPSSKSNLMSNTTNSKNKLISSDSPIINNIIPNPTNTTKPHPTSKLTSIPTLTNPSEIMYLDYSSNRITTIPKAIHLTYPNLSTLNLASNQLTSIEPICLILHLKQLHLECNLINFIPNAIKNLTKLQYLNLSHNKLWYVSQLIGLKELLRVRHHVIGERCAIQLQGNSVVVSNRASVHKLLQVPVIQKMKIKQSLSDINKKQSDEQKQNISPNYINNNNCKGHEQVSNSNQCQFKQPIASTVATKTTFNKHKHIPSTVSKHSKSKSFSQSLLDMSAIIANIPTTATSNNHLTRPQPSTSLHDLSSIYKQQQQQQHQRSVNNNNSSPVDRINDNRLTYNHNELSIRQVISQELAQKSMPLQQNNELIRMDMLMNITQQQYQLSPTQSSKHCSYKQLFNSIQNFTQQILTPAIQYSSILTEIQKKLTFTQKLNGIPQALKPKFMQINQSLNHRITQTLTLLSKLVKYNQLISLGQFSIQVQKLIESCSLKLQGTTSFIEEFYNLVVGFYLNYGEEVELKWFEVWGKQYQKLKQVFGDVEILLLAYLNMWKKVKRLAQLGAVVQSTSSNHSKDHTKSNPFIKSSPHTKKPPLHIIEPRNNPSILPSSEKKSSSRQSLNKLLFSQTKQSKPLTHFGSENKQSLLLSGGKSNHTVIRSPSMRNSKRKQQQCSLSSWNYINKGKQKNQERIVKNEECLECPLKDQEIISMQEELTKERNKAAQLQKQNHTLRQLISRHTTLKNQHQSLLQTQTKIVTQLHSIKPSTYQHILLQQALAVQQLLQHKTRAIDIVQHYPQHLNNSITFKSQSLYPNHQVSDQRYLRKQNGKYFYCNIGREEYAGLIGKENGDKKELDGVLLTEESKKSRIKSEKSVQRTYFKSNGTLVISNPTKEKIIKNSQVVDGRLSLSHQNKPFTIDSKAHPSTSSQHNQNYSLTRASFPLRSSPSHPHQYPLLSSSFQDKNEVFEEIIVNEFSNQSNDLNQHRQSHNSHSIQPVTNISLQQMHDSSHQLVHKKKSTKNAQQLQQQVKQLKQLSHQNLLKNQLINSKQNSCNNSINSNLCHQKLNIQQQINGNKLKTTMSPSNVPNHSQIIFQQPNNYLLSNKTAPNLHLLRDKGLSSDGYNYETCNTFETQNYRKYVKYHLRNNIKQLLQQKCEPCHGYDHMVRNTMISRGKNKYSSKNLMNLKTSISPKQKRNSRSIRSQPNSTSCQRKPSQRKYIQKLSLQHGN